MQGWKAQLRAQGRAPGEQAAGGIKLIGEQGDECRIKKAERYAWLVARRSQEARGVLRVGHRFGCSLHGDLAPDQAQERDALRHGVAMRTAELDALSQPAFGVIVVTLI
jgi:hypothetical protein